jgi:hypothetical protein
LWQERADAPSTEERLWFDADVTYVYRRCDIFNSDGTLWKQDVGYTEGQVSIDSERDERRSIDIVFDANDLDIDPDDGLWYDKSFVAWRGVVRDDTIHAWRLGEFLIDSIEEEDLANISVTGRDFTKKMMDSKFSQAVAFAEGLDVAEVIRALASNSGITRQMIPPTGMVIGKDIIFERGTSRWEAARQLANDHGLDLFFNQHGYLVLQPFTDPVTSPISLTFDIISGDSTPNNVISWWRKTVDARIYNHVVVTGEATANTVQVFAEAENNEPTSPTNIDRIGRRTYTFTSKFITTTEQAQETADRFLAIHALEQFEVSIESNVYPWADVGTTIRVTAEDSYAPERFLLSTLTIPLGLEAMSASAGRVSIVG